MFRKFADIAAIVVAAAILAVWVFAAVPCVAAPSYLYTLSDFSGPIPGNWVKLAVDRKSGETYVLDTTTQSLRVFNDNGMEVYRFPDSDAVASTVGISVADSGKLLFLCVSGTTWKVRSIDYRGEEVTDVRLPELPPSLATGFMPDAIASAGETVYLADRQGMKVAAITLSGNGEVKVHDLAVLAGIKEDRRADSGVAGFNVDARGNILFTIPVLFQGYLIAPDGKLSTFGSRGSTPGKFNIIGGIAGDDSGIYVTDTLRCVVMAFDRELRFVAEFGYRGSDPANLISPMDLAIHNGKIYVTQSRNRGVSVFRVAG